MQGGTAKLALTSANFTVILFADMETYKLNVEINGSKFSGEGPKDDVRSDYSKFLEALKKQVSMVASPASRPEELAGLIRPPKSSVSPDGYSEVFRVDKDKKSVSLMILPSDEEGSGKQLADSMLLILFAFKQYFGLEEIPVGDVATALRHSGFTQFKRLDYVYHLLHLAGCATTSGTARGTKYRITASRGVVKAQELVQTLLKRVS